VTTLRCPHQLAACTALVLASTPPARADRDELTIALRPTSGQARIWEAGTEERVQVRNRGFAGGVSLGVRDWLDLGGEIVAGYFDEASYQMATLPVGVNPLSGPLKRTSRIAQLRGVATLRAGVGWVPFLQLALGAGARHRTTALLYGPTTQGLRWLIPDGQEEEISIDLVAGARAGIERRLTVHWTAGVSAAVSHSVGVFRPDLQTADLTIALSYTWYPLLPP
jgi:hypothetical protein